jgi:hypothetical protein
MLSAAGRWLAEHSEMTTVVTRNPTPFTDQLNNRGYRAKGISCNYKIPEQRQGFIHDISHNKDDLILAWIHQDAISLLENISANSCPKGTRIIWVVGSDFHNPEKEHKRPILPDHISLEIVVLGFQMKQSRSRWLSH